MEEQKQVNEQGAPVTLEGLLRLAAELIPQLTELVQKANGRVELEKYKLDKQAEQYRLSLEAKRQGLEEAKRIDLRNKLFNLLMLVATVGLIVLLVGQGIMDRQSGQSVLFFVLGSIFTGNKELIGYLFGRRG